MEMSWLLGVMGKSKKGQREEKPAVENSAGITENWQPGQQLGKLPRMPYY